MRRHAVTLTVLVGLTLSTRSVRAQDSNVAEQLFREGKRLLAAGRVADACKAFDGSYRKDAQISTLLNLADCREKNGQYASAWGHFLDAERMSRSRADGASYGATAKDRAAKLESRLSYLIINVPIDANVSGLQITRNGNAVDEAEWNTDIPVDGGPYSIEGKAPGYEAWSTSVTVGAERDKKSVNVPRFRERPPTAPSPPHRRPAGEADDRPALGSSRSSRRTVGVVTALGGGAVAAGGLVVGYLAQQRWSDAKAQCGDDLRCDTVADQASAQALVDEARLRGNVSTVMTAAGLVAVGVGVTLWLTAPSRTSRETALRIAPALAPDGVSVVLSGSL